MRKSSVVALVSIGFLGLAVGDEPKWRVASTEHVWDFPRDHFAHPEYQIEWWYFTGQVEEAVSRRRFGYQFTFFRIGLDPARAPSKSAFAADSLIMGHAAVTTIVDDPKHGEHRFKDVIWRAARMTGGFPEYAGSGTTRVASCPAPAGSAGEWTLDFVPKNDRGEGEGFDIAMRDDHPGGFSLALSVRADKPLAFEGPAGVSPKNASGSSASLYYSFTRMATRGTVALDGRISEVQGASWMDHEISSSELGAEQVGWDWFSLQLDDGRDVMLYRMRNKDGVIDFSRGTVVSKDGTVRYLGKDDVVARPGRAWSSTKSDARYPLEWSITIASESLEFEVKPELDGAENVAPHIEKLHYWEGPIRIEARGKTIGKGYLELTGYGKDARLPL